jgi:hypothetical protein
MPYVLFESKAVKIGVPALTITGSRISFNAEAGDILHRVGARYLHILWDSAACKVALRPTAKAGDSAYKITYFKGKRGGSFSARSFLNHIRWNTTNTQVVPVAWNEKEKLLEAALPKKYIGSENKAV